VRPQAQQVSTSKRVGVQKSVDTSRGEAYDVAYPHSCHSSSGEPHTHCLRRPLGREGLAILALRKLNCQP